MDVTSACCKPLWFWWTAVGFWKEATFEKAALRRASPPITTSISMSFAGLELPWEAESLAGQV